MLPCIIITCIKSICIISVSGPALAYNVTGLTANTNYYFVISAVNGAGEGGKSAVYQTATGWFGVFKMESFCWKKLVLVISFVCYYYR